MEKIAVNNQIVSMRKLVKQAKVYVINKLVKQRKMLQLKKGTEDQLAKNKRKEERLCEEIKIIKKIPVDEVSRNSLMRSKDWKAMLSSKTSSLEERSFALLANFGPLQAEVENFITKNPRLVNLLPDFYEEWDAKKSDPAHQEMKRMKAVELKLKRKQFKARLKGHKKFQDTEKIEKKPNTPGRNKQDSKNDLQTKSENLALNINEGSVYTKEIEGDCLDLEQKSISANSRHPAESHIGKIGPKESEKNKEETKRKEMAIMQLDELQDNDSLRVNDQSDSDDDESSEMDDDTVNEKGKKDPFFMSADASDDRDVHDTADTSANGHPLNVKPRPHARITGRPNINSKFSRGMPFRRRQGHDSKTNFRQQQLGNRCDFGKNQKQDLHRPMNKGFPRNNEGRQQNRPRFQRNNKIWQSPSAARKSPMNYVKRSSNGNPERSSFKSQQTSSKNDSGLHPSWEAKRKLKQQASQLMPFQGKKTTFE